MMRLPKAVVPSPVTAESLLTVLYLSAVHGLWGCMLNGASELTDRLAQAQHVNMPVGQQSRRYSSSHEV
jgi:hypothetical protein